MDIAGSVFVESELPRDAGARVAVYTMTLVSWAHGKRLAGLDSPEGQ